MLENSNEIYRGLSYPWGRGVNPPPGEPQQVADGRVEDPGLLDTECV